MPDKTDPERAAALREAVEILILLSAPIMPHLAEECWHHIGHDTLVSQAPWPALDRSLLVEDTVTIAVQVNGKRRDELTIARDAAKEEIEDAALALGGVVRALGGKPVRKVIIVPQRIVNVVV
jgi:leucyl-tRNA synthetase